MFTGLVEHLGRVAAIVALDSTASGGNGFSMTIEDSAPILGDCHIGDSICVNGACLTVTEFGETWFKVGLAPETLERTDLGERKVGDLVNLERAMAAHVRFGGHFVQVNRLI
ncbi:Lumazine-binding protein, partial [Rhizoctonia solani]